MRCIYCTMGEMVLPMCAMLPDTNFGTLMSQVQWLKRQAINAKEVASPAGFEPATSGLEVRRAIHCATGT